MGKRKTNITIKNHFFSILSGLFVGSYIGIIGGGGATFIIMLLALIYGLSFHDAVANQKPITLTMSLVATIIFVFQGMIDYKLGLFLLAINIIGGWVGAQLINKINPKWLKRILAPVVIVVALRLLAS